jgi:hypothetical protein
MRANVAPSPLLTDPRRPDALNIGNIQRHVASRRVHAMDVEKSYG